MRNGLGIAINQALLEMLTFRRSSSSFEGIIGAIMDVPSQVIDSQVPRTFCLELKF